MIRGSKETRVALLELVFGHQVRSCPKRGKLVGLERMALSQEMFKK